MGFTKEGVSRWYNVLPADLARDGAKPGENDKQPEKYGRHTAVLSVCWDDWERGVRDIAHKNVARVA